jgi:hypothetical protein
MWGRRERLYFLKREGRNSVLFLNDFQALPALLLIRIE